MLSVLTQDAAGFAAAALCSLGAQLCFGVRTELAEERLAHRSGVGLLHLSLERQRVPTGVLRAERHAAGINHELVTTPSPRPAKRTSETLRNVPRRPKRTPLSPAEQNHPLLAAGRAGKCQRAPGGSRTTQHRSNTTPGSRAGSRRAREQREKRAFLLQAAEASYSASKRSHWTFHAGQSGRSFFIAEGPRAESRLPLFLVTSEDETQLDAPRSKTVPPQRAGWV